MKPLVIGVGNPFRSDDGIGIYVHDLIKEKCFNKAEYFTCDGDTTRLFDVWEKKEMVYLIDALVSKNPSPGKVHAIDGLCGHFEKGVTPSSTHTFDVFQAIAMGTALKRLPQKLLLYGIESVYFEQGNEMTEKVKKAGIEIAKQIIKKIMEDSYA